MTMYCAARLQLHDYVHLRVKAGAACLKVIYDTMLCCETASAFQIGGSCLRCTHLAYRMPVSNV